jgi:hypothetical protein
MPLGQHVRIYRIQWPANRLASVAWIQIGLAGFCRDMYLQVGVNAQHQIAMGVAVAGPLPIFILYYKILLALPFWQQPQAAGTQAIQQQHPLLTAAARPLPATLFYTSVTPLPHSATRIHGWPMARALFGCLPGLAIQGPNQTQACTRDNC